MTDGIDTAALVARHAEGVHARLLGEHGVASALGLWLLLALVAPAADADARRELEQHLGCSADEASRRATALLAAPHPAVRAAVAVWANETFLGERFRAWAASLGDEVESGPMPSPATADAWAAGATDGMIGAFPVAILPDTAVVLASALATDVSWLDPFWRDDPSSLGGAFGAQVGTALQAPAAHTQLLVDTDAAGIVAVHAASAAAGLRVVSVLAAPTIEPARVHAAALEVGARLDAILRGEHAAVDPFALPLGEGAAWSIEERTLELAGAMSDHRVQFHTTMAAWSARSDHALAGAPGVDAAFAVLDSFLAPELRPGSFDARQSAVAQYTREGFKAAAVTAMAARAGAAMTPARRVTQRDVTVRFNRPYAVLALADAQVIDPERPWEPIELGEPAWVGVPVFAAWVARPDPDL